MAIRVFRAVCFSGWECGGRERSKGAFWVLGFDGIFGFRAYGLWFSMVLLHWPRKHNIRFFLNHLGEYNTF